MDKLDWFGKQKGSAGGSSSEAWRSVASDLSKFFDDDRMQLAMSFQTKYLGMSPFQGLVFHNIIFLELEYVSSRQRRIRYSNWRMGH